MGLVKRIKNLSKTEKIVISSITAAVVIAVIAVIALVVNNNYLATTMRLLRVEGTVTIEDSTGTTKPVLDNIRFQSGDALSTGSDGLASVGLDDTKIVTLENDSRVEFTKQGKQLELNLTQGALFFEVTEKLADDEKYEIKTSNMTVGIRGTSGYVYYSESGLQSLIITDGVVKVTGYNPKTNETKVVEVRGGESVTAYLYDEATEDRDSIEFEVKEVPVEELPEFPLQMLAENDALLEKVCADTGWDKEELLTLVEALSDPDSPTPTPDEIIEITDTPTPTVKPTSQPTLTPTPTDTTTPSPSPKPTASPKATNTPSPTPSATATPTVTTTPTPTVKPTATPTATVTPTPTVAVYTVTFNVNGHGDGLPVQTVKSGEKAAEPNKPTADGYTFAGWYTDSSCTKEYDFGTLVTSDITLYAKWTHITFTVTFDTDGLGNTPSSQTVGHGGKVTKPANPSAEGYTFTGWYTNNDLTEPYDFSTPVTSDFTIYAGWSINFYTVTFDTDGKADVSSQSVAYGDRALRYDDPTAEGLDFGGWYTDAAFTNEYDFSTPVTSDITLYANWITLSYTVIYDSNGHGEAPGYSDANYGDRISKPADPSAPGYTFGGWYKDKNCPIVYDFDSPVKEDFTLYAKWTINSYTVTFDANGQGTAPAAQKVDYGSKATEPTAPTASIAYNFGGWYTDKACTQRFSFNTPITSNITLYAKWVEKTPVFTNCFWRPIEITGYPEFVGYNQDGIQVFCGCNNARDEDGVACYTISDCWTEETNIQWFDFPTGYVYFDESTSNIYTK